VQPSFLRTAIMLLVLLVVVSGCSGAAANKTASSSSSSMPMSIKDQVADFVKDAPATVREAYEFAASNPHEMEKYPCFCGCGKMGHTSNRSCYVKNIAEDGKITFDDHALGCGICVDITKDVMRLKAEGRSSPEVRRYIDTQYSPYGSATDTTFPTE
jgi:hypothetical protein